ncbi:unnamed protein product [Sphagnum balticum]
MDSVQVPLEVLVQSASIMKAMKRKNMTAMTPADQIQAATTAANTIPTTVSIAPPSSVSTNPKYVPMNINTPNWANTFCQCQSSVTLLRSCQARPDRVLLSRGTG